MEHVTSDEDWLFWENSADTYTHTDIRNRNTSYIISGNQKSESARQLPLANLLFVLLSPYSTTQRKTSDVETERGRMNFHFKYFVDISLRAIVSLSVYFCYHFPF
jgi:hypothetical protein